VTEFPPSILDLLHLQGVGPKTVATLYRELQIERSMTSSALRATGAFVRCAGWGLKKKR